MRPRETIYLFKSARRPLYRQQNLHLLAAERGTVVELSWNRSWLAPEYFDAGTIAPGTPVVFVLTDRPYELYVPVRAGEVMEALRDDVSLRLRVALGTWLRAAGGDVRGFTAGLRAAQAGALPPEKFVARRRDSGGLEPCFDDAEDAGWRDAVDAVLALTAASEEDPYGASVFFRPAAIRVNGELHPARREPLATGDRAELIVRFHNPHLENTALAAYDLRAAAPRESLRVRGPSRVLADGAATFELTALAEGAELTLSVGPDATRHTSVTLRFPARSVRAGGVGADTATAAAGGLEGTAHGHVSSDDVAAAWDAFRSRARALEPADELPVVEAFAVALPTETAIAERQAVLLAETGDEVRAFDVLRVLDAGRLGEDARFLFLRLHALRGNVAAAVALIEGLDLAEERRLERLLGVLDDLEGAVLGRLVCELSRRLADPPDQRALLARVEHRLESAEHIAEVARNFLLATLDASRAAGFLRERARTLRLTAPVLTEVLIEAAHEGGLHGDTDDFADLVSHRVINLIGRGDVEEALSLLRRAQRNLPRQERDRLYHRAADRLVERDRPTDAASALVELAYAAAGTGDLDSAVEAAERARGIFVASGKAAPDWVRAAVDRVEAAWNDVEPLVEAQASGRERRAGVLRDQLLNQTILIVGGFKRDRFREPIEQLTGATVEFGEQFRTEGDSLTSLAERIRAGRYALVVFRYMFSGHDVSDTLKKACAEAGVPFAYAVGGGLRGIEEAVWRELGRE